MSAINDTIHDVIYHANTSYEIKFVITNLIL